MSSGSAHTKASLILSIPCAVAAFTITGGDLVAAAGAGVGGWAGCAISPDLDMENLTRNEWSIIRKTFGLGFLFTLFWFPYSLLHRHRGSSHWPVIGTLVRVLYIALPAFALALFLDADLARVPAWAWTWLAWAVGGLAVSDTAHCLMDLVDRGRGRGRRRRSSR